MFTWRVRVYLPMLLAHVYLARVRVHVRVHVPTSAAPSIHSTLLTTLLLLPLYSFTKALPHCHTTFTALLLCRVLLTTNLRRAIDPPREQRNHDPNSNPSPSP